MRVSSRLYKSNPWDGFVPMPNPDTRGWHIPDSIFDMAVSVAEAELAIEVGSWKGSSAMTILNYILSNGVEYPELVCVDTWLGGVEHWLSSDTIDWMKFKTGRPQLYEEFMTNMYNAGLSQYVTPFPQTSQNAAEILRRLGVQADFIFVDGSHEQDDVFRDLVSYWEVLRVGGVMMGDDLPIEGVREAFKAFCVYLGVEPFHKDGNYFIFQKEHS